ncbi:MAG TPA: uroporphyrinogen-III synthase [Phaeodactylibacter sp.]|nr:uroporphyrinogen-III synthase [Phaeodactylibacter sp.]
MPAKTIFISRDIDQDLPFVRKLKKKGWKVYGTSLVECSPHPFPTPPDTDWIFFYSKQAIRHYFDGLDQPERWKGIRMGMPLKVKILRYATFGKGAAKFLKSYRGIEADFAGCGIAEEVARDFLEVAKDKKVLFVRGKNSRQTVQQLLKKEKIDLYDLVVYDNKAKQKFSVPQCHYLLFTTPMQAEAYYQRYAKKKWQKVFAVEPSTAEALVSLGLPMVCSGDSPDVDALISSLA